MSEYIKLDDAVKKVEEHILPDFRGKVRTILSDLPTIDIVTCEKCGNNKRNVDGVDEDWCLKFGYEIESDDWCSYAERIEE